VLWLFTLPSQVLSAAFPAWRSSRLILWTPLQRLPNTLSDLPHLKELTLFHIPNLRSLPPSIGRWPSLRALYLYHLPKLHVPPDLLSKLQQKLKLYVKECPSVCGDTEGTQDSQST